MPTSPYDFAAQRPLQPRIEDKGNVAMAGALFKSLGLAPPRGLGSIVQGSGRPCFNTLVQSYMALLLKTDFRTLMLSRVKVGEKSARSEATKRCGYPGDSLRSSNDGRSLRC